MTEMIKTMEQQVEAEKSKTADEKKKAEDLEAEITGLQIKLA